MPGYGSIARIYDGEYRNFDADLALYLEALRRERVRGPVVELGCGTGRIALPLARSGHRVTGVDISPEMLARARRNRRALPGEVAMRLRFSLQDMTVFGFPRSFSAAIIAFSTLALVTDAGDRARCLGRVHQHLDPGGLLLIDLPNPPVGSGPGRTRLESRFQVPPWGHVVDKVVEETDDPGSNRRLVHYLYTVSRYSDGTVIDRLETTFGLARLDRREVEAMLYGQGFDVEDVLGDYSGRRHGPRSPRMIFQARRL
jgi:SAM-dependent methyltransferase